MKKKVRKVQKRTKKESQFVKNFLAFGNKDSVFKGITISAIILTILAPIILKGMHLMNYFIIVWVLEVVYILMYTVGKKKK